MGLGQQETRCQTEELRVECTTRNHRHALLNTYNCAPANMRSYYGNQVTRLTRFYILSGSLTIILQLRLCSPPELDNIAGITGGAGECLERCQGPIVDVERLPSLKNEEALAGLLSQYENIKYPLKNNITYPFAMKGGKDERELECSVIF